MTIRMNAEGNLGYLANIPVDVVVDPTGEGNGAKHTAQIWATRGGVGGNGSPIARANGIPGELIGVQGSGLLADLIPRLAAETGMRPHLIPRPAGEPAISVSVPNGRQ